MRVSVKALALSCVGAAVALYPESFFSKLYRAPLDAAERPGTERPGTRPLHRAPALSPAPAPAFPGDSPVLPVFGGGRGSPALTGLALQGSVQRTTVSAVLACLVGMLTATQ